VASAVFRYLGRGGRVVVTRPDGTVIHDSGSELLAADLVPVWGDPVLGPALVFGVDGEPSARFTTDCSTTFGPGLLVGDFQVVSAQGATGADLCPLIGVESELGAFVTPALGVRRLLVPTSVDPAILPEPDLALTNHFKCYDVTAPNAQPRAVISVKDQVGASRSFEVGRAVAICHPVRQTIDGLVTEIVDDRERLACYAVAPVRQCGGSGPLCSFEEECGGTTGVTSICAAGSSAPFRTTTENEFGAGRLGVGVATELCVPSAVRVGP
jgi:hypothetical protein